MTPKIQSQLASLLEADPAETLLDQVDSGLLLVPLAFSRSGGEDRHQAAEYRHFALPGDDLLQKFFRRAHSGLLAAEVDEGSIKLELIDAGSTWELSSAAAVAHFENGVRNQQVPTEKFGQEHSFGASEDAKYIRDRALALHRSNEIASAQLAAKRASEFSTADVARSKLLGGLLDSKKCIKGNRLFVVQGGPWSVTSFDTILTSFGDAPPQIAYYSPAKAALRDHPATGREFRKLTAFVDPDFDLVDFSSQLSADVLKRMAMSMSIGGGNEAQVVYWSQLPGTAEGRVASLVEIRGRRNLRVICTHPTGGWHRHRRSRHEPDYRHQRAFATCM